MENEVLLLLRELITEVRLLREAVANNAWTSEHSAYWTAQTFRGKDSAGNPR